jgi:hypothetical protein
MYGSINTHEQNSHLGWLCCGHEFYIYSKGDSNVHHVKIFSSFNSNDHEQLLGMLQCWIPIAYT